MFEKSFKKKENLKNQKWAVKGSGNSFGDESVSTKTDEPHVVEKSEKSVPIMDEKNFLLLSAENFKKKIGKVEISNRFYSEKNKFDVEKTFNGNVTHIFGKMVEGKAKGVQEFYASKKSVHKSVESVDGEKVVTPKDGQAWVSVFFVE